MSDYLTRRRLLGHAALAVPGLLAAWSGIGRLRFLLSVGVEEDFSGLRRCRRCGRIRGTALLFELPSRRGRLEPVPVHCLCEGIPCTRCRKDITWRPTTNYYDERDGKVWHVPWFSSWCRECHRLHRDHFPDRPLTP